MELRLTSLVMIYTRFDDICFERYKSVVETFGLVEVRFEWN